MKYYIHFLGIRIRVPKSLYFDKHTGVYPHTIISK